MRRSWRERPTGSIFSRLWRPWESLNPFRRRGRVINARRPVGIRNLVTAPEEVRARPERRWRIIGGFFLLLLVVLLARLFALQVLDVRTAVATVDANSLRVSPIPAPRGLIVSRSGQALVANRVTTEVELSRAEASLDPAIKGSLSALTGVSVKAINAALSNPQYDPYQPAPILLDAPARIVEYLKLHSSEFPGISIVNVATRTYPAGGNVAPPVLGYVGPITGAEIAAHPNQGYQTTSQIGKTGIEAFYEQYLRGRDGKRTVEVDAFGNVLATARVTPPVAGDTVQLNIDLPLQEALQGFLANQILTDRKTYDPVSHRYPQAPNGAAVVLDPNTGAVLAMASYPAYNLNSFTHGLSEKTYASLARTGAFNNYAIQGLYTPGSTFKLFTATAMMQTGILSPTTLINDTGIYKVPGCLQGYHGCVFHDAETYGNGLVNLPLALTVSSDYYFYNLGYLFWAHQRRYGQTAIQNVARQYGAGQYTNIDLPNEVSGRVDSPAVRKILHREAPKAFPNVAWYTGDNIEMAFGQGATALTPIELADAYATFANGGTRYAPEVAAAIRTPTGRIILRYRPRVLGHVNLPPRVRDPILQGLIGVIANPRGTGYYAFQHDATFSISQYVLAGKTGTASNAPGLEPNSLFVAFGPVGHPRYVVACVIGEGGYGANAAAPVVAETFSFLFAHPVGALFTGSRLPGTTSTTTPVAPSTTSTTTPVAPSTTSTTTTVAPATTTTAARAG